MKAFTTIRKEKRELFESMIDNVIPLSFQVDIVSHHNCIFSRYEIPCETEDQKKTILDISKAINLQELK